jgi:ABC-2 type transport system ATP-binding protein
MIEIRSLHKTFGTHKVLNGVDMSIDTGTIYGLVGSNGCGKTTILKHIIGIYKSDQGSISCFDQEICHKHLDNVYYVQDDLFFPLNYTLDTLFDYEAMLYKKMSREKYKKLLAFFKLPHDRRLRSLSKGQKKQAAFILAIASMTDLILLDEIVDGLDAVVRKKFWQVIMAEVMDRQLTIVISSHALTELDNICDKVGILHEGKIVKEDAIDSLKDEIKRVQFAIQEEFDMGSSDHYEIVKDALVGKVHFTVIKGDVKAFEKDLKDKHQVLLFDVLTMNLEEIFISELGGLGYGTEEYTTE